MIDWKNSQISDLLNSNSQELASVAADAPPSTTASSSSSALPSNASFHAVGYARRSAEHHAPTAPPPTPIVPHARRAVS